MTTTAYGIENTIPFYPALDGSPLQGGSVWFGVAGQNPVTNPVSVYLDAAATQPIAQPIAIANGRTVDVNGTPVSLYLAGDFSRLVKDGLGRQLLFQSTQPATQSSVQAQNWAQQTGSDVTGAPAGSRSAKSWSQDDLHGATYGGSAKDWAQSPSLPDGASKSAKSYAADAGVSAGAAASSASDAATARDASYGNAAIFTGTSRSVAVTTGAAATGTGAVFKTRQQFGQGVDLWQDNGASPASWQAGLPFGVGETAARVKAIEGATIEDWPVPPDFLFDSLDFLIAGQDGRLVPNSVKLLSNPPSKNLSGISTGDHYWGTGGNHTDVRRVTGAGGAATGVEVTYAGNNVNSDYVPVINGEVMDPGTYTVTVSMNSKTGKGAQTIQWWESVGATTQTDSTAEGAFVAKSFTFTIATRQAVNVRLRSTTAGSAFNFDREFVWENDGNANPGWSDDAAGGHARNKFSGRGTFLNDGLFIDSNASSFLDASLQLAANGLPVNINDITVFVSARLANVVHADQSPAVTLTPFDGSSPVAYFMGVGNTSTGEGPVGDGCISTTPTSLETTRLCLKGEDFHVFGTSTSVETVQKALDGLVYRDYARSGLVTPLYSSVSRLGLMKNMKADVAQVAIWVNRGASGAKPFTSAQIKAIMAKMKKHILARGGTMESFRDILFSEGDSRNNWGQIDPNGPGWNWQVGGFEFFGAGTTALKVPQIGWSSSILGAATDPAPANVDINYVGSSLWSRKAKVLAYIQAAHDLGLRIHFTWMNDINDTVRIPANATQYASDERVLMAQYYAALEAGGLGSRLNLFTCTPVHTNAAFEPGRATLNTLRRNATTYAGCYHSLIDIAADATMGTYSATTAPPGYVDNLHFNKAGALIVANLAKTAIAPYRLY